MRALIQAYTGDDVTILLGFQRGDRVELSEGQRPTRALVAAQIDKWGLVRLRAGVRGALRCYCCLEARWTIAEALHWDLERRSLIIELLFILHYKFVSRLSISFLMNLTVSIDAK